MEAKLTVGISEETGKKLIVRGLYDFSSKTFTSKSGKSQILSVRQQQQQQLRIKNWKGKFERFI